MSRVRKVFTFGGLNAVVVFCSKINSCVSFGRCRALGKAGETASVVVCLNPKFHNEGDALKYAERALARELRVPVKEVEPCRRPLRVGRV